MIKKTLNLTLSVKENGKVTITFYEPESGTITAIHASLEQAIKDDFYKHISDEIHSWISMIAEELEDGGVTVD